MKQKTALLAILVALLVSAVIRARGGLFGTSEDVRSAAFLGKVAAEANKGLPKMIDPETEMTSTAGLDGVFVYNYRLVNMVGTEVDGQQLVATLKPQVAKAACSAAATRDKFLRQNIALRYSYADKSGVTVASFDVNPGDCSS